jgi:hypothetical protein
VTTQVFFVLLRELGASVATVLGVLGDEALTVAVALVSCKVDILDTRPGGSTAPGVPEPAVSTGMDGDTHVVVVAEVPEDVAGNHGPAGVGPLVSVGVEDVAVFVLEAEAVVVEAPVLDGVELDVPEACAAKVHVGAAVRPAVGAAVVEV